MSISMSHTPSASRQTTHLVKTVLQKNKKSLLLPTILLSWPFINLLIAVIVFIISSSLFGIFSPNPLAGFESEFFGSSNPLQSMINFFLYSFTLLTLFFGAASVGVGIILFIKRCIEGRYAKN